MLLLLGLVFTIWWYIVSYLGVHLYSSFPALLGILCGVVCSLRMCLVKLLTDATSTFTSCDWLPRYVDTGMEKMDVPWIYIK